jgi:hypothetical protein
MSLHLPNTKLAESRERVAVQVQFVSPTIDFRGLFKHNDVRSQRE